VRDALPLLHAAERVVLCAVAEGNAEAPADDGAHTVVPWLATHGNPRRDASRGPR
jgi:hypothetical protein